MSMDSPNTNSCAALAVLGSTGSIGTQTLDVVRSNRERLRVAALAANNNIELLAEQVREFRPAVVALADPDAAEQIRSRLPAGTQLFAGEEAAVRAAVLPQADIVVCGIVGFSGFAPLIEALRAGKNVALANKESIVAAGGLVKEVLAQSRGTIVPVDSEHNSVFQCILGRGNTASLRRVILTASGGPFFKLSKEQLCSVTPDQAVKHPRWSMGPKISVDSATLMNKGLEVIEAAMLFDLRPEQVDVLIHPESLVHGLAEYADGTLIAALFETDMRVPISYALSYLLSDDPRSRPGTRALSSGVPFLDLAHKQSLNFFLPDHDRFPAISLCYAALEKGATAPAVLSAANEIAVQAFLGEKIGFCDISCIVREVLNCHEAGQLQSIGDVFAADSWARGCASQMVEKFNRRPAHPKGV